MRRVTASFTVGAGVTGTPVNVTTPNDNEPRTLHKVIARPATQGVLVSVLNGGYVIDQFDASSYDKGDWPAIINEVYDNNLNFAVAVQNTTGGSVTIAVTLEYAVGRLPNAASNPQTGL